MPHGLVPHGLMIVDDDERIRFAVRTLFTYHGVETIAAQGCDECLGHLRAGFRGVILMDVMMPIRDGWDTIRAMVEEGLYEGNIVAMLTARDVPDEKMEGLQHYVIDYITKPFDPDELVATVREYFEYFS